jgi:hypothetical protein
LQPENLLGIDISPPSQCQKPTGNPGKVIDRDQGLDRHCRSYGQAEQISVQEKAMEPEREITGHVEKQMPSRRQWIRAAACAIGGAVAVMAATPAQAKMSQKVAEYQSSPKDNQSCANCALYRAPGSCTLIDGNIISTGWCRFYSRK